MKRILYLDPARGFIVLVMPAVHVVMLYSQPTVQQSLLGDILRFLAEGPGAQLFMFVMGASIGLSKSITPKKVINRTLYLLIGAFVLNLFKFSIPSQLGLLPVTFLEDFPLSEFEFLLMGDIFHFAAIAYPLTYIVYRLKYYPYLATSLAIAVMLAAPYCWDLKTGNSISDQVLSYFTGGPPYVFFPVFPWLVYALIGLAISHLLDSGAVTILGLVTLILSLGLPATIEITTHYRTMPADTLFHLSVLLLWLSLFRYLQNKLKNNLFFQLLTFCSKHITLIYIIQWILICWCMAFTGYLHLALSQTLYWMLAITGSTLLFTLLLTHVRRK